MTTGIDWIVDIHRYNSLAMQTHISTTLWRNRTLVSIFAVALLTAIASAAPQSSSAVAQPKVYKSAKGYHLTYPSGWQILNAKDRAAIGKTGSQLRHNVDLSDVDVLIHAPSTDPIRSINVNVSPNIVPATQYYLDKYKELLSQQLSASTPPQNLVVRLTKVGRYDAILAAWISDTPGAGRVWEEQFVIPGNSHTFIVTCTSEADSSAVAAPIFANILSTFQIDKEPPPMGSGRIHEILQEAKSYQAADAKTGAALQEIVGRQTLTFAEFEKQCADLQVTLAKSNAMEKRKRKMLSDLQFEFRDDSKVQPIFNLLYQMEDISNKAEPIWHGMIACSGILASAEQNKQEAYQNICVEPAHQQLSLLVPELNRLGRQLQIEVQKNGGSLPRDFLQAIGQ